MSAGDKERNGDIASHGGRGVVATYNGTDLRYIHQDHLTGTSVGTDNTSSQVGGTKYYPNGYRRNSVILELVGVSGFEPPTSASRTRRAYQTALHPAVINGQLHYKFFSPPGQVRPRAVMQTDCAYHASKGDVTESRACQNHPRAIII